MKNYLKECKIVLKFQKKDPGFLIKIISVFENADALLLEKELSPKYKDKCIEVIRKQIDEKFEKSLKNSKEIHEILEKSKFSVSDLVDVLDFVVKCFPKKYEIF